MKGWIQRGRRRTNPRILIVTPEITYLPSGMGNLANHLRAKAGGLADVSASLVAALFKLGADVHVALPHYRRMFNVDVDRLITRELQVYKEILPDSRIHLAQDRIFYYRDAVYSGYQDDSRRLALVFQREVINNILPSVRPDLVHCNDWMTGLIPAMAKRLGIPCLFTIHNIHTQKCTLASIEETGIDAAEFWPYLYYTFPPGNYEQTRNHVPVDLLASGIFSAHYINTVSPKFLSEIVDGLHDFIPGNVRHEVAAKMHAGCATGILNAPDDTFNTETDTLLEKRFSISAHVAGKLANKRALQARLGLDERDDAPMLFWPSRLDPIQKGCQLVAQTLYQIVSSYWEDGLQVVFIANGSYQQPFHDIVQFHDLYKRVAVCDFDEGLSHVGYAASDFTLVPSLFEPCGLPQMVGALYGSLPIVNDTGGLHDTVQHLNVEASTGNGFVFNVYGAEGFRWAVDQAIAFYRQPAAIREREISRIMSESKSRYTHDVTAEQYFDVYEQMLERPITPVF
ncbi:MAG: glycogen/starch synthase [Verrucomicrobia bacterium]|nr:glycogen/starch synthase [Verrucomicrobiota bacterium]